MITGEETATTEAGLMDRLNDVLAMGAEGLLERIGSGHITPAAYDTGWVARIPDPEGYPEFPESLEWLQASQRDDGSWGAEVFHEYDRYINTLSAAIALKQWGRHTEAVERAEEYLSSRLPQLGETPEGVSSDHLVALLLEEARRIGLELPYELNPHPRMGSFKRAILALSVLDRDHPLAFFSEILGRVPNQRGLSRRLQLDDGSIMSSTSATAASIVYDPGSDRDHTHYAKLRYLKDAMVDGGGIRHYWNLDTMELAYGLYNLMHAGVASDEFVAAAMRLERAWTPDGVGFSARFPVADLDDTAFAYRVLTSVGREPDPRVFDAYFRDDHFVTFKVESRGRPGPNIHAIEALRHSTHPERQGMIDATVPWLRGRMVDGRCFVDEWHLSPAYCTSHAIPAFHMIEETLMERCVSFFLDTQHPDGSWGFVLGNGLGTIEETAYALQGLLYYHSRVERLDESVLHRAVEYVVDRFPAPAYPEMWAAKVLFAPRHIIESLVTGTLLMFKRHVGGDHSGPL